jgi:hypothetical protein
MAPTSRVIAASFGMMPTISVRRLISLLSPSRGLVLWIFGRWSLGKLAGADPLRSLLKSGLTQTYPQVYPGSTSSQQLLADVQARRQNALAGFQDATRAGPSRSLPGQACRHSRRGSLDADPGARFRAD